MWLSGLSNCSNVYIVQVWSVYGLLRSNKDKNRRDGPVILTVIIICKFI